MELLAVMAIVAVLTVAATAGATAAFRKAAAAKEMAAIRKLINAYLTAATDADGYLPAGYDKNAGAVAQRNGKVVSGEPAHRYPWRLMPYLDGAVEETLYVSRNRKQVDLTSDYLVSLYPSFGMNEYFVGGHLDGASDATLAADCVRRIGQASFPSKLLVFASARGDGTGKDPIEGYFKLSPPNLVGTLWSAGDDYDEKSAPDHYGHLDLRHDRRAACAFLDGHVALLDIKTLKDMRYWSARAAEQDNPSYSVTPPKPTGPVGR